MNKYPIPESLEDKFELFKILAPEFSTGIIDPEWVKQNFDVVDYYVSDTIMSILFGKICLREEKKLNRIDIFSNYSKIFHPSEEPKAEYDRPQTRITKQLQEWCHTPANDEKRLILKQKFKEWEDSEDEKTDDEI